ncbi:conserved protein of unknown function [Burkholderia multivorans]
MPRARRNAVLRRRAGRDRPRRVRAPFAPRAGIQRGAVQARDLHRQRVVASGHAGAALQDHAVRLGIAEERGKRLAQLVAGLEAAFGGQVVLEEMVERAGDVAADAVERFVFAAIAVGRARVDDDACARREIREHGLRVDGYFERRLRAEIADGDARHVGRQRLAGRFPGLHAAVEHCDRVVAEPAQQPPQARGIHPALRIVDDDLLTVLQPAIDERGDQRIARRQRMAAVLAGLPARQVAVEVEVLGAREMACRVRGFARAGVREVEAAVEYGDAVGRRGEQLGEIGRGDERGVMDVWHDGS